MFSYICPECGREVPPAYSECPDCARKKAPVAPVVPAAAPTTPAAVDPGAALRAAVLANPPREAPRRRPGLPTWVLAFIFTLIFGGLVAGVYYAIPYFKKRAVETPSPIALETPRASTPAGTNTNPLQKHIEIVGLRLIQDKAKKAQVRFVVVNHSGADIADLTADVSMFARTQKSGEEPVGAFSFKLASLGPYESKEVTAALNTNLQVYELPDWQNLRADMRITAP